MSLKFDIKKLPKDKRKDYYKMEVISFYLSWWEFYCYVI